MSVLCMNVAAANILLTDISNSGRYHKHRCQCDEEKTIIHHLNKVA